MHINKTLKKSLILAILPAALVTFMLDYGSKGKTFIVEAAGENIVVSGLDGMAMYLDKYGVFSYIISIIPTFALMYILFIVAVIVQHKFIKRKAARNS